MTRAAAREIHNMRELELQIARRAEQPEYDASHPVNTPPDERMEVSREVAFGTPELLSEITGHSYYRVDSDSRFGEIEHAVEVVAGKPVSCTCEDWCIRGQAQREITACRHMNRVAIELTRAAAPLPPVNRFEESRRILVEDIRDAELRISWEFRFPIAMEFTQASLAGPALTAAIDARLVGNAAYAELVAVRNVMTAQLESADAEIARREALRGAK